MANTTRAGALSIHGTNPQVSFQSPYGKPKCELTGTWNALVPRSDGYSSTSLRYSLLEWVFSLSVPITRSLKWLSIIVFAEEHCFALDAASIIDKAVELNHVGGTYANTRPTEFMCLVLKLLQLQPEREIVLEYLRAEEFKWVKIFSFSFLIL